MITLPRVLGIVVSLLLAIFALDFFFLRGVKKNQSTSRSWDVAPIIGFLGAVLLALAFVEATRREVMDAWRWGIGFGIFLSACAVVGIRYRASREPVRNQSRLRAWLRFLQTYALVLLFAVLGVVIAVRVIGALLEVFIAGALGTLVIAIAVAVFAVNWRKRSVRMPNDR